MKLNIVVGRDRNGYFVAEVPALPGCFSRGRTLEEAVSGMRQVIDEWFGLMAGQEMEERVYYC